MVSRFTYSRWDGTQKGFEFDADALFESLTDDLLYHGDVNAALRKLMQQGMKDRNGDRVQGLREMLDKLRREREERLDKHDLGGVYKEIADALDDIVDEERHAVEQAVRDAESRVMFSGYDPLWYKLAIWTLSAVIAGIAGALYVPQVGIINPGEMSPAMSIEIAIWVAVGGRGTLVGAILGAFLVNGAKSWFTVAFPEYWLFFLGAIFIAVTLFLPQGVIGLLKTLRNKKSASATAVEVAA